MATQPPRDNAVESQVLGSLILFEDTQRVAALAEETRTLLKERLKA